MTLEWLGSAWMDPVCRTRSATRRLKEEAILKLADLPEELLLCIAQGLPLTQLPNLGSTSKLLRGVAQNGTLWQHIEFPSTIAVSRGRTRRSSGRPSAEACNSNFRLRKAECSNPAGDSTG